MHTQEASNGESIFERRRDFDRAYRNVGRNDHAKNLIVPWEGIVKMSYFAIEFPNASG